MRVSGGLTFLFGLGLFAGTTYVLTRKSAATPAPAKPVTPSLPAAPPSAPPVQHTVQAAPQPVIHEELLPPVTTTVSVPPQTSTAVVQATVPVTIPTLDPNLTIDEIDAVSYALSRETLPQNLALFGGTFFPDYPVTGSLLQAQSKLLSEPEGSDPTLANAIANAVRSPVATVMPMTQQPSTVVATMNSFAYAFSQNKGQDLSAVALALLPQFPVASALLRAKVQGVTPMTGFDLSDIGDTLGDALSDIGDAASDVGDALKAAVNWVSDEGKVIGGVLKALAPVVALWPGIGTALSVAMSAAGAYACGDPIDQGIVDTITAGLPGGPPRVVFGAGTKVVYAAAQGKNVGTALIDAGHEVTESLAGKEAAAAYDTGVQAVQGKKIGDSALATIHSTLAKSGPLLATAFDMGVTIAKGGTAMDVLHDAFHGFMEQAGVDPALMAGFDAGWAIAQGASLQEAGFQFLRQLCKGQDDASRIEYFIEVIAKGGNVVQAATDLIYQEAKSEYLGLVPIPTGGNTNWDLQLSTGKKLDDTINTIVHTGELIGATAQDVADKLKIPFVLARAAVGCIIVIAGSPIVDPKRRAYFRTAAENRPTTAQASPTDAATTALAAAAKQSALVQAAKAAADKAAKTSDTLSLLNNATANAMAIAAVDANLPPFDAGARVNLTNAGLALEAPDPRLQVARQALGSDWATTRGFDMGVAVRFGPATPWSTSLIRKALATSGDGTVNGWDAAMALNLATAPSVPQNVSTFMPPSVSPADVVRIQATVAQDLLRQQWIAYYKSQKSVDPTIQRMAG